MPYVLYRCGRSNVTAVIRIEAGYDGVEAVEIAEIRAASDGSLTVGTAVRYEGDDLLGYPYCSWDDVRVWLNARFGLPISRQEDGEPSS